jgi:nucleotide-binding universal stress UspA family protein
MRRILVAVDGTRAAQEAAQVALQYAGRLGARVTFLHVLPARVAGHAGEAPDFAAFEAACETYAKGLVEEVLRLDGAVGARADSAVAHGHPTEAIVEAAAAQDVDLVIVGARHRGPVARTLLGSVSAELIARCPKPVLVVPEPVLPPEDLAPPG